MGTSLALGAAAARELGASRLLVLLADMPHVTASHGAAVLAACTDKHASASLCDGVRMPPACFPAADFTRLAALSGDHGARDLIADLPADALVEAGPALFTDIDMPETGGPA